MAQLVARLVRNEKVGGSNPPSSTTGRHPIRMSVFLYAWRGVVVPGAVLLVAPLVFRAPEGPAAREARRPHFVRRRASKPARALRSLRRPPHRRRLVADMWLGTSSRSPARPRRRPLERPCPLAPSTADCCRSPVRPATRVKPSSPLLACAPSPVKPTTPLQARYPRFRRNFGEQRRHGFHGGVLRFPHWC